MLTWRRAFGFALLLTFALVTLKAGRESTVHVRQLIPYSTYRPPGQCSLYNLEGESSTTERTYAGYCHPDLACPPQLPIAYLESPRSGCTSFKKMLAELEGKPWEGHGTTQLTCCADQTAASKRLKVIVVRNPFSKVISSFLHDGLCGRYCSETLTSPLLTISRTGLMSSMKRSQSIQNAGPLIL